MSKYLTTGISCRTYPLRDPSLYRAASQLIIVTSPLRGVQSTVMSMSVCLSAPIIRIPHSRTSLNFYACCLWLWLGLSLTVWWHCNILCPSGFADGIKSSYAGANGPESSTMLFFEELCQVAVSGGRQTAIGRVHQNAALGVKSAIYDWLAIHLNVYMNWTELNRVGSFQS